MREHNTKTVSFLLGLALAALATTGGLQWVAPGLASRATAAVVPSKLDFLRPSLIKNWGISNSIAKSDIRVLDAWKIEMGSPSVVVAVIDTGVDANHRDLAENIWTDPSQRSAASAASASPLKTQKNSVYGWDFVTNKANPADDHGHGTHVAGIIGAVANPKAGVTGVAQKVSIMAVKYYSDRNSGSVNLANTIKALNYAIDHGAKIINYSGGGPQFSQEEYVAMKRAEQAGILVVCAAGNERHNADLRDNYYYPAAYGLKNIISVAATDIQNRLLASSNWGIEKVDVAAPGENIYSTLPGNQYGYMSGTSQATAFVTGIAALLLSKDPTLKPEEIKAIIKDSVDRIPTLSGKVGAGGRVNAHQALLALNARKRVAVHAF